MKLQLQLFLLMICCSGLYAGNANSPDSKVTLEARNVAIRTVLQEIEEKTDYLFLYNQDEIDLDRLVTVKANNDDVSTVLAALFRDTDVKPVIERNSIVLMKESSYRPIARKQQQNGKRITGVVSDHNGEPVAGANILEKGSANGTVTNADGGFSLTVSDNALLQVSYIGYITREITISAQNAHYVIELAEDLQTLDEVVVVGYGSMRRSDITGSVATVKVDDLIAQPTSDLSGMLKGKVAGLYVTLSDARPGGSSSILLRGIRSLRGGNSPLCVVDGVPLSDINELNIDDVESISVLKDASAQAIYGARGSNGVILVTTKRGGNTNNKVKISYNGMLSYQNVDPHFEIFSPEEYLQLRREAYRGDRASAEDGWIGTYPADEEIFTPLELESMAQQRYVNWTDYAFKKDVPLTKHDVSIAGGNDNTQYTASLGYYYQDGLRYSSDLTRYSGKITLDQKISKTVKTGFSVYYINYLQHQETNSWLDFFTFSPVSQLYDENGDLVRYPTGDGKSENPLMYDQWREYDYKAERIIMNGYLELTPQFLPGFKYKLNANMNSRNRETDQFNNFEDPSYLLKGNARANFYYTKDYLLENILSYNRLFGGLHQLDLTAMQGIEAQSITSTTANATSLGNDFFGINSMSSALESEVARGQTNRSLVSFMGRVNYIFGERYLLNFTMRADASSVFGANHKWGYFPTGAIGWNLHNEQFIKPLDWLNEAKIRISYGSLGNQAISPYGSLATADKAFYVSNGTPVVGYLPGSTLPNPDLRWETTTTLNTSLDFSLFNHRLSGTVEYYKSNTYDLLVNRKVPNVLGYASIPANLGEIENRGLELTLTGFLISNNDFTWSVTSNFSRNRNKLVKGVLQDAATGEYIDDVSNLWFIGEPVNVYYSYNVLGIWQIGDDIANSPQPNARPGDPRVEDVSGPEGVPDGAITTDDRIVIHRDPKWLGSLSTEFAYKNIELSANLYTVQGVIRNNQFLYDYNHGGRLDGVLNGVKQDYWTPENPSNTVFRPHAVSFGEYRLGYQDASYLRLRNITLSYSLPKSILKSMGLARVKIYVSGDNLWTQTKYQSYSPEGEVTDYPETKNYTFGLNINF